MMTNNANANTVAMFNQQIATKNQVEKRKNRAHNTPAWIQPVCFQSATILSSYIVYSVSPSKTCIVPVIPVPALP